MTYTEVVDTIENLAINVNPDGTFVHGKRPDASLISSCTAYPLIWLAPFRETTDRVRGVIERQITLSFFAQDSTNNSLDARQALIQDMWDLKNDFCNSMNSLIPKTFSATGEQSTPEYAQLAGTISGYSVTFKMTSKLPC